MTAHEDLLVALVDALRADRRIPCSRSGAWVSSEARERAEAAEACQWCPVLAECATAAESTGERWGVWGGRDLTPKIGRPRRRAGTAADGRTDR